ncbi:MAG: hypothetical protein IJ092_03090 [Atopobiaceae bacterium]|nr:hypothetical protein [Atopobiaceae bacterium]
MGWKDIPGRPVCRCCFLECPAIRTAGKWLFPCPKGLRDFADRNRGGRGCARDGGSSPSACGDDANIDPMVEG